ncbi:putative mitochondrial chaperone BCS1-B [Penicillium rolfsii]|nr:putative mitochondrial chaperone BCS1-B [Penicillium rolfsii]
MAFNQSAPSSTRVSLTQSDAAILEALIPGYTFVSRIFLSYLHIDLAAYLQYLVILAVFGVSMRYLSEYLMQFFETYLISTAEMRLDDEIFNYLMYWWSRRPHTKRTNRFLAGVRTNGYWSNDEDSDHGDSDSEDEEWNAVDGSTSAESFDDYWTKVINRDKYKKLRFTPAQGRHYFWYQGRLLMLERRYEQSGARWVLNNEKLYLSCLGRDPSILHKLLSDAQHKYVERDGGRTIIYRGQRCSSGSTITWCRCMSRPPRPLNTVILDSAQKHAFLADIENYLEKGTAEWYAEHGIPYRRGYLLSGPPGTGKSSLCFAVAGKLGLKIYLLNLSSRALDEDNLYSLFSELPRRCILLVEDVDTSEITHSRGPSIFPQSGSGQADLSPPNADSKFPPDEAGKGNEKTEKPGITLSSLLNVLDGVAASEGRILVMTTNHPEKLDDALLRAGRVDMHIEFRLATSEDIENLYKSIYSVSQKTRVRQSPRREKESEDGRGVNGESDDYEPNGVHGRRHELQSRIESLAKDFASAMPSGEFSPAEIQGYLLKHRDRPERAIRDVAEWVKEEREKKRAKKAAEIKAKESQGKKES